MKYKLITYNVKFTLSKYWKLFVFFFECNNKNVKDYMIEADAQYIFELYIEWSW